MEKKATSVDYIATIRESTEKRNSYITFAVSLLAIILLIVFAVRPTVSTILRINKEVKSKKRTTAQLQSRISAINSLDTQYKESKDKFETLQMVYPAEGGYTLLLSNIDSIVSRNGFVLSSISFDDYGGESYGLSTQTLSPTTLRLTVRGQYGNFITLLKDIESLPMYPVVEGVSFSSQVDENGQQTFSMSVRIYNVEKSNFYKI